MSELQVRPLLSDEMAAILDSFSPPLRQLLANRDIASFEAATVFLEPSYTDHLHDPLLLNDMSKAAARLLDAVKKEEMVVVFSDYDCDGIPGAVILHDLLRALGHEQFVNVIPHRHYDGFGLSVAAVERMVSEHEPTLIITIDCGTSDHEAVLKARELGVDVIITDHHEPKETLPEALAVVNPKIGNTYPFPHLCGAAVVYKLAQAVLASTEHDLPEGHEKWWLDMVGIATVADMVPLVGENRALAHYGLTVLRKTRRPGLQQLFKAKRVKQSALTEEDIGFVIGPRINAASRMDTPEDAFHLLSSTDVGEAGTYLAHLEKLNNERKAAVAVMTKDIHKRMAQLEELPPVLVLGDPAWRPSLVGLAANKLAEEHDRPVFLWGRDGNGILKGSCRSGGDISVVKLMDEAKAAFSEYGGHHGSGGFSILDAAIHTLGDQLVAAFHTLGSQAAVAEPRVVEMELPLRAIDRALLDAQNRCAPFGMNNPRPLYLVRDALVSEVGLFGKGKEHVRVRFTNSGLITEGIAFFTTPEQFSSIPTVGESVSLLAYLEESYFMNRPSVRLRLVDII